MFDQGGKVGYCGWKWGLGPECVVMIIHFLLGGGPSAPVSLLFRFLIYWQYTLSEANLIPSLLMKVTMAGSKVPGTCCKNMSWFVECGVFCHVTIIIAFCFRYISSRIKHSCLHLFSKKHFFGKAKTKFVPWQNTENSFAGWARVFAVGLFFFCSISCGQWKWGWNTAT